MTGTQSDKKTVYLITGNSLLSGDVIYLADGGEAVMDIARAAIWNDEDEAKARCNEMAKEQNEFVGLYVMPIEHLLNRHRPLSLKEQIRASGPTIQLPQNHVSE